MAETSKKNSRWFKNMRKHSSQINPGMRGFLFTCNSHMRERECTRDALNLLNLYYDDGLVSNPEPDVDGDLQAELEALQKERQAPRFQAIESGAKGIVFIKTTLPDPTELVERILKTIEVAQWQHSKVLLRLLPVQCTCKAYLDDIVVTARTIFPRYFVGGAVTFSILFSHRNNQSVTRKDVIDALANEVTKLNSKNKVNLTSPDFVVMVEVIKGICCLSVVKHYYRWKKYNLMELCLVKKKNNVKPQIVIFT